MAGILGDPLAVSGGLAAFGNGISGGYYGAMGTVFQRQLAAQKQASETNLQNAQAGYFGGRNMATLGAAQTRADGQDKAAGLRSQAQMNIASGVALGKLPAEIAGQDPATARATIRSLDALNPNLQLERGIYGDSPEGMPGGPPAIAPAPGGFGGGALTAMSAPPAIAPPPPPYAGPTQPLGAPPAGMPMAAAPPLAPAPPPMAGGSVAGGSAAGVPPPAANPFSVPPAMAAGIAQKNAFADLAAVKTKYYPKLTESQVAKNMADVGLARSQGRFTDARTGEVVPDALAKQKLDYAQAAAANANASSLPAFRQGLVRNGATVAGSDVTRANTYAATQPVIAQSDATRANSEAAYQATMGGVAQQNANTGAYRAQGGAAGPNAAQINAQQAIIDKANAQKVQVLRGLMVKGTDGTMTQRTPTTIEQNMIDAADFNIHAAQHQQNVIRGGVAPLPVTPGMTRFAPPASLGPLPTFPANLPGAQTGPAQGGGMITIKGHTMTRAQAQAMLKQMGG